MDQDKPNAPSSDHEAMAPFWRKVDAIMGGAETIRKAGEEYLPRFEAEGRDAYERRRKNARFTNIFRDIVENLAQKPFSTEVMVSDDAPEAISDFVEDVNGCGDNLHTFAGVTFFNGIAYAADWILVDYINSPGPNATVAQERAAGARPIWARYPATSVLAAYSDFIGGREEFVHVRLAESEVERTGYTEATKERVRVLNREKTPDGYAPATWEVFEKQKDKNGRENWTSISSGVFSIGVIPLVPFVAGRRMGKSWRFHPPMRDVADLQVEHYQQENGLKNVKELTAFPMLAGNGVSPEIGEDGKPVALVVGPSTILYTGGGESGSASWGFVEPAATSMRFLADDIEATAKELRELGRQPLTAQSGNLTVVTTAFAAQKGNSAIQAWALGLKDALENALRLTAQWLKVDDANATVIVNTDFDLGIGDDDTFQHVVAMYRDGTISRDQLVHEAKRRGIVDQDYDPDDDLDRIIADMGRDDDVEDIPRIAAE